MLFITYYVWISVSVCRAQGEFHIVKWYQREDKYTHILHGDKRRSYNFKCNCNLSSNFHAKIACGANAANVSKVFLIFNICQIYRFSAGFWLQFNLYTLNYIFVFVCNVNFDIKVINHHFLLYSILEILFLLLTLYGSEYTFLYEWPNSKIYIIFKNNQLE